MHEGEGIVAARQQQTAAPGDVIDELGGFLGVGAAPRFGHGGDDPAGDLVLGGENPLGVFLNFAALILLHLAAHLHFKGDPAQPAFFLGQGIFALGYLAELIDGFQIGLGDALVQQGAAVRQLRVGPEDAGHEGEQVGNPGQRQDRRVVVDRLVEGFRLFRGLGLGRFALRVPVGGEAFDPGIVEGGGVLNGGQGLARAGEDFIFVLAIGGGIRAVEGDLFVADDARRQQPMAFRGRPEALENRAAQGFAHRDTANLVKPVEHEQHPALLDQGLQAAETLEGLGH